MGISYSKNSFLTCSLRWLLVKGGSMNFVGFGPNRSKAMFFKTRKCSNFTYITGHYVWLTELYQSCSRAPEGPRIMSVKPSLQDLLADRETLFVGLFDILPLTHLESMCEGKRKEEYTRMDEESSSENSSGENQDCWRIALTLPSSSLLLPRSAVYRM